MSYMVACTPCFTSESSLASKESWFMYIWVLLKKEEEEEEKTGAS